MPQPVTSTARKTSREAAQPSVPRKDSNRDLIEQIVVALILALVIRGFEAEAFVIPTGSMAPTLMGRHKEINCPQCGVLFTVNASDEVEGPANRGRITGGTCQNCRYSVRNLEEAPSFKGDRILVMKFLYDLPFLPGGGKPDRWDVVVFKYPEEPEVNYIKRLVGLPNEELRILRGNLLTRPLGGDEPFQFAVRPLTHQLAMRMLVYDDRHRPALLADAPDWQRWRGTAGAVRETRPGHFRLDAKTDADEGAARLRYAHLVPDPNQWLAFQRGETPEPPRPTLITDFYSYNTGIAGSRGEDGFGWFEPHWVGDLTLTFQLTPIEAGGRVEIELVSGGIGNRCVLDLDAGTATLFHGSTPLGEPVPITLTPGRAHSVRLANVDDRLTLWIDGATPFGDGIRYADGSGPDRGPTAADLDPVGIATEAGASVEVSELVLDRDIYYTVAPGRVDVELDLRPREGFRERGTYTAADRVARMFEALGDPERFAALADLSPRDFAIRPGHYVMMGDNSPGSKDSRGWSTRDQASLNPAIGWDPNLRESWEVPESLLIGKAFFVYWPHAVPFGPDIRLGPDLRIPFRPYVERMKTIR